MMDRCTTLRPLIHDYLEGELATARSHAVREHLELCRSCRSHAEAWIEDLDLLLEVPGPIPPAHWSLLKRKLRWRGPRATSQVAAWLQVLSAIAAFAVVFGAVGFLIWLESSERGASKTLQYDADRRELTFHLSRGERCQFGALILAAQSGAPTVQLTRVAATETWHLSVLWGSVAVLREEQEWFVVQAKERWRLPLDAIAPHIELEVRARWNGVDLGPWPRVRILRCDGDLKHMVAMTGENGRATLDLPLRLEPAWRFEASVGAMSTSFELPSIPAAQAEPTTNIRYLELSAEQHLRYLSVRDANGASVADVRVVVGAVGSIEGPSSAAQSSKLGIAQLPIWFEGPYTCRVFTAAGELLFEKTSDELPEGIALDGK